LTGDPSDASQALSASTAPGIAREEGAVAEAPSGIVPQDLTVVVVTHEKTLIVRTATGITGARTAKILGMSGPDEKKQSHGNNG
jgi:hypothetical protein